MVRIDVERQGRQVTLRVQGRLRAEAVTVVARECRLWLAADRQVRLDLSDVRGVGRRGLDWLRRLPRSRVEVSARPSVVRDMLTAAGVPSVAVSGGRR